MTRFWFLRAALCVYLAMWGGSSAMAVVLVQDGENRATIIITEDAPGYLAESAQELGEYIEKASGARPPVTADPEEAATPARVWVGFRPEMVPLFPDADLELHHPEEIVFIARGDDLAIFGRDRTVAGEVVEHGTEHAVSAFLRERLGVRWLWPGELGEDVEQQETIRFDDFEYRHPPQLRQRLLRIVNHEWSFSRMENPPDAPGLRSLVRRKDAETRDWYRRHHGLRGSLAMSAGHAFGQWWDDYHEEHPEYFALHPDGSRDPLPRPSRAKLCVSNPAVAEQWLDNAEQLLRAQPARIMVSASPNDSSTTGKCWCDECRSWDHPDGPTVTLRWRGHTEESPALTDRYVRFWNILARGLRERFPEREVFVGAWAYGPYRTPPIGVELEDNIAIGFVGNLSADISENRERDRELWREWSEMANTLIWRPNLFWRSGPLGASSGPIGFPYVFFDRFAEDFNFMARHSMVGTDISRIFHFWATQGPQYYLIARMSWDPYADAQEILDDFYRRGFGPGADAVADYFRYLEQVQYDLFEAAEGQNQLGMADVFPAAYNAEVRAQAAEHLDRAAALVADGPEVYRERVEFLRTGLAWVEAQVNAMEAINALRRGGVGDGALRENVRRAVAACEARDELLMENAEGYALGFAQYLHAVEWRSMERILGPVEQRYMDLLAAEESIVPLPNEWDFRLDPDDEGTAAGWYRDEDAPAEWDRILITDWWGNQLATEDEDDPEQRRYLGVAWYRTDFEAQPPADGEQLWLEFGAIDESGWVYVNGQLIGGHLHDSRVDPNSWRKPRRFDISGAVRPGRNRAVVKVQALQGQGGIWRGAFLRPAPVNLLPDADFADGQEGWHIAGEEDLELAADLGQYVGEQSLRVEKGDGELSRLVSSAEAAIGPGRYLLTLRYRQEAALDAEEAVRVRLSLYPTDREAEAKRVWMTLPADPTGDTWREAAQGFEVPEGASYRRVRVDAMFRGAGTYWLDEIALQKTEG